MNIAFEITPLIAASGTFGDKSGVYRYMYGLLKSFIEITAQKNKDIERKQLVSKNSKNENAKHNAHKTKIILFSFNRDFLRTPLNPEISNLLKNNHVVLLNKAPKAKNFEMPPDVFDAIPPLKIILKLINRMTNMKGIFSDIVHNIRYKSYLNFVENTLKKYKVSIVYYSETGFYPLNGFKNIITVYDLTPQLMPQFHRPETNDLQRRKMSFAKCYCDGVICISNSTKEDLLKEMPAFEKKKILVCYPGLDSAFNEKLSLKNTRLGLNELNLLIVKELKYKPLQRYKYLLYWGTFEPRKNLPYMVRAFADLQKDKVIPSNFKLVIVGGQGWGQVKNMINNYIIEYFPVRAKRNIITLDFLSDDYIKYLVQNAYAVVYPSLYEGFGLPVLESMALGTPVICSNNSSLPEVGGTDGVLYVNPWDYNDLKNKMSYLINNPRKARAISAKGYIQSKKFNWKASAKKLCEFLKRL